MTETTILDESAVSEIEARANAATKGPWAVWDSCSWRRIGTVEPYADGNVICPTTQSDGHPDLLAKREDLEFAVHAREDIPALCATVKHLRERVQLLDSRWCECGHTKDKHGFFSDHDECYECDQESPDLCCEWRPVARPDTQLEHLQSQLEQLRAERERAIKILSPNIPRTDLCDAARQIVFAHGLEKGSAEKLQSRLAQVEQERDAAKTLASKNVHRQIEGVFGDQQGVINTFRSNAIKIFQSRALEWGELGLSNTYFAGKEEAAKELATELEKL